MSDWTAGYVADIGYTYGYYTELNPVRVRLAFLNAGLVAPEVGSACELGFGQGMSANLHAAASVVQWRTIIGDRPRFIWVLILARVQANSCGIHSQNSIPSS